MYTRMHFLMVVIYLMLLLLPLASDARTRNQKVIRPYEQRRTASLCAALFSSSSVVARSTRTESHHCVFIHALTQLAVFSNKKSRDRCSADLCDRQRQCTMNGHINSGADSASTSQCLGDADAPSTLNASAPITSGPDMPAIGDTDQHTASSSASTAVVTFYSATRHKRNKSSSSAVFTHYVKQLGDPNGVSTQQNRSRLASFLSNVGCSK